MALVSVLTGYELQEDIDSSVRAWLDRGEDILRTPLGVPASHAMETKPVLCPQRLRHLPRQLSRID